MANRGKSWTPEQEKWLLQAIQKKNVAYCAEKLERTEGSIISRLKKIATEMHKQGETIENIHQMTKLNMEDIRYIVYTNTLANHGEPWDESQDDWLRKFIKKIGKEECAKRMERTVKEIENRVDILTMKEIENGTSMEDVCSVYGPSVITKLHQLQDKFSLDEIDQLKEPPYYVVLRGRSTGIYSTWEACKTATMGVHSKFKKCNTIQEVKDYVCVKQPPSYTHSRLPPLSEEQEKVLTDVFSGKNVLLLGSAGTGKTTVIKHLKRRCATDNIEIGITGTTGTASILIEGKTLHSFLGIGLGKQSPIQLANALFYKYPYKVKKLRELKMLLVDEVSMLNAELFTKISEYLSIVREDPRPYGGLQLILCGDFYQLPPVEGDFVFKSEVWEKLQLTTHILTKIYRQEDSVFQGLLERAKEGNLTAEDMVLLQKCKKTVFPDTIQPTRLFSVNAQVDRINKEAYDSLEAEEKTYTIICPNKESKKYVKSIGMPSEITLKVGAQVMVTRNNTTDNQLVNGTRGIVTQLCDDSVVIMTKYGKKEITRYEVSIENEPNISYKYIPLKLAWALTIHKGQGTTLDCVEVDLGDSIFIKGQAYTALSRVKNLESLRILDIHKTSFQAHPEVLAFYKKVANP